MKKNLNYKIIFYVFLYMSTWSVYAQLPKALAHYPLNVKIIGSRVPTLIINAQDVSGNANHGSTYPNDMAFSSQLGDFFGVPALNKQGYNNGYINIPNPYLNDPTNRNNISVSFWINWDASTQGNLYGGYIIINPYFNIYTYGNRIEWEAIGIMDTHRSTYQVFDKSGWYFVCFTYQYNGISNNAHFYSYKYNGSFDPSINSMKDATDRLYQNNPISADNTMQLLGKNFQGQIRDVRFFNTTLTKDQVNTYRNLDYNWANGNYQEEHDVHKGTYSFYPFDNNHPEKEVMNGRDGVYLGGNSFQIQNRFGDNSAFFLKDEIKIPPPLGTYNIQNGFTCSFWIGLRKIEEPDFNNILSGLSDTYNSAAPFAITKQGNKFGVQRYTRMDDNSIKPYFLWLYSPLDLFSKRNDWYHIILVYDRFYMRTFIGRFRQNLNNIYKSDTSFFNCSYNYQGMDTQDLDLPLIKDQWLIGSHSSFSNSHLYLDDLRIYNYSLSDDEAWALHVLECQKSFNSPPARLTKVTEHKKYIDETKKIVEDSTDWVIVYPNPTENDLKIKMNNSETRAAQIRILDLMGNQILTRYETFIEGSEEVIIKNLKSKGLNSGMYILEVLSTDKRKTFKIIVI